MDKLLSQNEWIILNGLLLIFGVVWMFRAARMKDKMEYYKGKAFHFEKENIDCIREVKFLLKRTDEIQAERNIVSEKLGYYVDEVKNLEMEILKMDPGFEFTMST